MKERELRAINMVDLTIIRSSAEMDIIRPLVPDANLKLFPLLLSIPGTQKKFNQRKDILFIGGFQHTPNIDAVKFFVSEIMPLLRKKLPGVCFHVVGSKPTVEIIGLKAEDVIITGYVKNIASLLDKFKVSVAPLRFGAGVKGKIGTAMAAGLPVVATSLALEGMSLTPEVNILLADSKEETIDAITRIYLDEELWSSISKEGLVFASQTWGAEAAWDVMADILTRLNLTFKATSKSQVF